MTVSPMVVVAPAVAASTRNSRSRLDSAGVALSSETLAQRRNPRLWRQDRRRWVPAARSPAVLAIHAMPNAVTRRKPLMRRARPVKTQATQTPLAIEGDHR